jgi:hypothetical protein
VQQSEHWKDAILGIIKTYGKESISLQQIYAKMKNCSLVTEYHLEPWKEGKQLRYQCWIREYLTALIKDKKILRVGKGMYKLRAQ